MATPQEPKATVYFDGSCPLCRREIALYQNATGAEAVSFCDISRPETPLPPDLTRESAMARFHVRDQDGTLKSGAAGFALLWSSLPRWRWLGWITSLAPVTMLAEQVYRGFLRIRPRIQRFFR